MRALDRKLLRDLQRMRAQVITIALVVACGIASYVTIEGTHASLLAALAWASFAAARRVAAATVVTALHDA